MDDKQHREERVLAAAKSGSYISISELVALQRAHASGVTEHLLDRDIVRAALQPDLHPAIATYLRGHPLPGVAVVAQMAAATDFGPFFDEEGGMGRVAQLLPPAAQLYAATHDSPRLRTWLARMASSLSVETLALLAQDDEASVRAYTALGGRLTDELAGHFAADEPMVQTFLAQNPHLGLDLRRHLTNTLGAEQLAGCPFISADVAERLSAESGLSTAVESTATWKAYTESFDELAPWQDFVGSYDAIDQLCFMIRNWPLQPSVQSALVDRVAEAYRIHREEPAHHDAHRVIYELDALPRLTADELGVLVDVGAPGVARNTSLPVDLQERIEVGADIHVRSDLEIRQDRVQLAANPALDPSIRDRFLRSQNRGVASRAVHNLRLTREDLDEVAHRIDDDVAIAVAFAAHPALSIEVMERLEQHEHPKVREILARNYSAPIDLRDRLATDPVEDVRYWAMSPRTVVWPLRDAHPPLARVAIDWR